MTRSLSFMLLLFFYQNNTSAQLDHWNDFQIKAEKLGLETARPLENQFKSIDTENDLIPCDFAISKRKDDLEIRFILRPVDSTSHPHIDAMSMLTTLATNDQETVVSVLPIAEDFLELDYKADWGFQAFFTPKDSFSKKQHCKLVAIYKENTAIVYMLFLFDETEKMDLEPYEFILAFD